MSTIEESVWWKELVVYQVYPRSFQDSNGDGVGDINGITERLDHIKDLGVGAIWLSPVYPSPNEDNGYDISDYCGIQPEFGTMEDWERFLKGAHDRDLKVVMDIVVNHSSDQHEWFKEARKSRDNPYHDYYIWRQGKENNKLPPNNWQSFFSGTAWQYNEATDEYYMHLFAKGQPDLNWENPKVREEVKKVIHFWAQKGVDGFRLDVINVISKTPGLPEATIKNPADSYHWAGEYFFNGPNFMKWMTEIRSEVFDKYKIFTVGETPEVTPFHGKLFTHATEGVVNMIFQFELTGLDAGPGGKFDHVAAKLADIKRVTNRWQKEIGRDGWNSNYLENHDNCRSVSRYGCDQGELRLTSAKMLAAWYIFLKGTPYIYQGQEIGMTNVPFTSIDKYQDIETMNYYKEATEKGMQEEKIMLGIRDKSRDNARTPMQWDSSENAGFAAKGVKTWLDLNPNYTEINVEASQKDENSILHFYKKLLKIRKEVKTAVYGDYEIVAEEHPHVFAYTRSDSDRQVFVCANFTKEETVLKVDPSSVYNGAGNAELLIGNYSDASTTRDLRKEILLRPYEALIFSYGK